MGRKRFVNLCSFFIALQSVPTFYILRSDCIKVFLSLLDQKELEAFKNPLSELSALQLVFNCVRNASTNCQLTKKPNNYEEMLNLFNEDYENIGFYDGIFYRRFGDCASFLEGKKNVLQQL